MTAQPNLPFAEDYEGTYDNYDYNGQGGGELCEFEGKTYSDGESFKPDDCTTCTCYYGEVTCEQTPCDGDACAGVLCPDVECENQYIPLGQCCPVCPGKAFHRIPASPRKHLTRPCNSPFREWRLL